MKTRPDRRWAVEECTLPARRRICDRYDCRYHLASDDDTRGRRPRTLEERHRHVRPLPVTCSLDVAAIGGCTIEATAELLGISRQAVDLIVARTRPKVLAEIASRWTDEDEESAES